MYRPPLDTFGFLGGGGDLHMLFCHSVTAGWVVGTLRGGLIKNKLFALKAAGR